MCPHRPIEHKMGYLLCRVTLIFTLVTVPVLAFGRGQQENVLSGVDQLIAEKRYTEALSILIPYVRDNPKNFDAAQKRIQKILGIKERYNALAQELLDEMERPDPDSTRIVALTDQLIELDPERRDETMDFVNRTRFIALFKTNMRRLERILDEGLALVEQGSYAEGLQVYVSGLPIYQPEFFTSGFGQDMENRVRRQITDIRGNIAPITTSANALQEAVNALEALSGQPIDTQNLITYRNAFNRLSAEMERFTALRDIFLDIDTSFKDDLAVLRRNFPEFRDRNFLAFAVRLMEGRVESPGGIMGVFDTIWNKAIPHARDLLSQKSQAVFAAISQDAALHEYDKLSPRSEILAAYASFPANLEILWGHYETKQKTTIFNQPIPAGEEGNYLKFRYLTESAIQWRTLGQLGTRFLGIQQQDSVALWRGGRNGNELVRAEQSTIETIKQIRTDARNLLNAIQQQGTPYRTEESRYPDSGTLVYLNGINTATNDFINLLNLSEEASSIRLYTIANGLIQNRIALRQEELRESTILYQGTPKEGDYIARYPTRAAELLTTMDTSLESDRQALQTLLGQFNAESSEIAGSPQIRSLREDTATMLTIIDGTRSQGRTMAAAARSQSIDAANLRREGDRLYAEAQAALNRNDFETAQTRIVEAGERYFQSLEREYDEATWEKNNVAVRNLGNVIAEAYSAEVLRQVTQLVAEIRDSYYNGDFDLAERLVSRAENIWKQTQKDPYPDLVYWASMIEAGARSSRTIPPTAPLYMEMSQLLSDARKNYEEGRVLFASSRSEGTKRLNSARQNIAKVKLVYPMNEEAGILDLRIDQVLEGQNFPATLGAKVENAIARTKTGLQSNRIQALNELRNYKAAFPENRNWDPIIYQAEIDAGIRPRDPTPEEIAEAQQIVADARRALASGNPDQMRAALNSLTRARQLYPNNQDVTTVSNAIARELRIKELVLDTEAERLYQQAALALNQDNVIRARQLLNQIYARNPEFQYVNKVAILRQRVESR